MKGKEVHERRVHPLYPPRSLCLPPIHIHLAQTKSISHTVMTIAPRAVTGRRKCLPSCSKASETWSTPASADREEDARCSCSRCEHPSLYLRHYLREKDKSSFVMLRPFEVPASFSFPCAWTEAWAPGVKDDGKKSCPPSITALVDIRDGSGRECFGMDDAR